MLRRPPTDYHTLAADPKGSTLPDQFWPMVEATGPVAATGSDC
jgi:hypothetical protein